MQILMISKLHEIIFVLLGEEKLKYLHKCYSNGQTYHQGEVMFIQRQCYSYNCICDNYFDERNDPSQNPNCELVNQKCDLELRHLYQFQKGCAPIYFGKYPTCPGDQYRCREYILIFIQKAHTFIYTPHYFSSPIERQGYTKQV